MHDVVPLQKRSLGSDLLRCRVLVVGVLIRKDGLRVCSKAGLGGGNAGSVQLGQRLSGAVNALGGSALGAEGVVRVTSGVRGLVGGRLGSAGSRVVSIMGSGGSLVGSILGGGRGLVSSGLSGVGSRVVSVLSSSGSLVGGVLSGGSSLVGEVVGSVLDILLLDFSLRLVLGRVQVGRVGGVSLASTLLGLADELRSTVGEVGGSALGNFGSALGLLSGDSANLLGLLIDEGAGVVNLGINDLAVVDVDKRNGVDQSGEEKSKTPGRHDLDEEVRDEGDEEGTNGDKDILAKHDALELNDEEVDELLNIVQRGLEGLTRNSVVLARAHARGKATVHDKLADNFGSSGNWKFCQSQFHQIGQKWLLTTEDNVESLEKVLEDGDIAGEEDEGEN